jgi:Dullard-like phosphatase family protein
MIYNNQGGNIGFSCSKISQTKKKLFTPIKLSIPLLSEIKNYREKSLPNSPRNETKNIEIQNSKANFILPKKNSNSEGNSPIKKTKKKNKNMFFRRNESSHINHSLLLVNDIYDSLIESIKKHKVDKKYISNKTINLTNSNYSISINNSMKQYKKTHSDNNTNKKYSSLSFINIPKILKTPYFNSLEEEAKSLTNSIEIHNFYEYTKNCMRIIVELKENKNKASKPNKVKIQNPDNHNKLAVFDLDETLIHGVINISNYKNEKNIISIITPSKKIAKIGVNIRPHWEEAIKRISKLYTIVIYTASHSSYADAVLNFLDPQNKYFYNRLYRSNCIDVKLNGKNFYIKDMNIFEGFDTKNILIVDNSVMSFAYHLDNGIPILPYYDAEKDYELLFVAYYFENLYHYDNLSTINKEYMKLDYYLNQAIKEYNDEIEEEEDEDFNDDSYNYNCNINNLDNDKCINKNLLFVNNDKEIKRSKRRQSQFVEQYEIDFNELRQKFSKDEEQF